MSITRDRLTCQTRSISLHPLKRVAFCDRSRLWLGTCTQSVLEISYKCVYMLLIQCIKWLPPEHIGDIFEDLLFRCKVIYVQKCLYCRVVGFRGYLVFVNKNKGALWTSNNISQFPGYMNFKAWFYTENVGQNILPCFF